MAIPSIQLTSAAIALRKVENNPKLFESRRAEIIAQFLENHNRLTRQEVSEALWAKYIGRFNAK